MSFIVAIAVGIVKPNYQHQQQIFKLLALPDFVKEDADQRLKVYLEAIQLDGYDEKKIRKMIVLGNKGSWLSNKLN